VGKDYMTEVKNSKEFSEFLILAEEVQNNQYESGIIFQQDPPYGTRIKRDRQVTLKVAVGTKMETIPNVNNHDFAEVKKTLEQLGFVVEGVAESSQLKFGTVIRTSPEQGTQAPQNSTVFVYYASDENLIEVPLLVGWTVEDAKRLLESMNLSLDENFSYENSDQPEGTIIKQSPEEKLKVTANSKVSVTLSTGIAANSTANVSFKLPSRPGGTTGALMVTLNNDVIGEKNVLLDGDTYSMEVVGSGANNTLKVFVDSKMIYSCKIDFSTKPASIKDEKVYDIPTSAILPNVVGKDKDDAVARLNNAGFTNIVIVEKTVVNPLNVGKVQNQIPGHSAFSSRPLDTVITLEVGVSP
ncbi:MAG TPA: PASTA domain-containing protein, partial [Clostridiales bacterium]|nr:PASTA domain-containing protein [Clostridiales bacterium]